MADGLKELLEKASHLDAEARFELIERLIDADAPGEQEWGAAWAAEAHDRLADFRAGKEPAFEANQVLAEGRRRLTKRKT